MTTGGAVVVVVELGGGAAVVVVVEVVVVVGAGSLVLDGVRLSYGGSGSAGPLVPPRGSEGAPGAAGRADAGGGISPRGTPAGRGATGARGRSGAWLPDWRARPPFQKLVSASAPAQSNEKWM